MSSIHRVRALNMKIIELESSFELEFYITSRARARNIKLDRARVEFRARVLVFESSSSLAVLGSTRLVYTPRETRGFMYTTYKECHL